MIIIIIIIIAAVWEKQKRDKTTDKFGWKKFIQVRHN